MITKTRVFWLASFASLVMLAAFGAPGIAPARAAAAPVLLDVAADSVPAAAQGPSDPTITRFRYTTINFDVLPGPDDRRMLREPPIVLELFDDATVVAAFDRYDAYPGGVTWVGRVEGVPMSTVTLAYADGLMTGSVVMPHALYQIRPAPEDARVTPSGAALHIVSQVDQSRFLPEAAPIELTIPQADRADEPPMNDSGDTIDVMVLYTALAAAYAGGRGGIDNLINLGISETNTSYANSGVNPRIRLVHAAQVAYTESGNFSTNLNDLRNGVGALAGVAALRDAHQADLVMMLVRPSAPNACGIAFLMTSVRTAFAPFAFSVTDASCVSPNYSFAHEFGHNMGARHDWFVDGSVTPFSYAHGYVNPASGQRWRTIMAYPDMCAVLGFSCTRVLYWANPEKQFIPFCDRGGDCSGLQYWSYRASAMGVPAGTRIGCQPGNPNNINCDADDSRALNNTALTVANFRQRTPLDR
jgi:hypothetical protein